MTLISFDVKLKNFILSEYSRSTSTALLSQSCALPFSCRVLYIYNHAQKKINERLSQSSHGIAQRTKRAGRNVRDTK